MDDLVDLNWSETSVTSNKQTSSPSANQQKDAFADLLSLPKKASADVSKVSLNDQLKLKQQPFNSSTNSSPGMTASITPTSYGSPLQAQASRASTATATATLKQSEPARSIAKSSPSSSLDSLLDPFGSSAFKKQNSDRNTPLNMLRNQTTSVPVSSNNDSSDVWDFDYLDTKISNTKASTTASSSNNVSTATSISDPFEIDLLAQSATTTALLATTEAIAEDNPLGELARPAVKQAKGDESMSATDGKQVAPGVEQEAMSMQNGYSNAADNELAFETTLETNNKSNGIILTEEEEETMLAQLIDMGFTLQQSKFAIEATAGQGVQAAIDLLVQNSEKVERIQSSYRSRSSAATRRQKKPSVSEQARRALFSDNDISTPTSSSTPSSPYQSSNQAQREPLHSEQQKEARKQNPIFDNSELHAQTEKIVSQAQELGGFLYKNAASYFKAGKEKVTKVVGDWQEQQRANRLQQMQAEQTGPIRPKWMKGNGLENTDITSSDSSSHIERFVDDDVDDEIAGQDKEPERQRLQELRRREEIQRREQAAVAHRLRQQQKSRKESLIDDGDQIYVSPSRRRGGTAVNEHTTPQAASSTLEKKPSIQPQLQRKASPAKHTRSIKERTRPVINAPADVMTKVNEARALGNEKFKLGQFGEAEEAYSKAIEMLPEGHDHQVILCNNRALTRLKNGSHKKCIEDCERAYQLAVESGGGNTTSEGVLIQWRDQITKSLYRKAEALENIEKYKDALATYEELVKYEGTANLKVNQGMSRCRQALNPKKKTVPVRMSTSTTTATKSTRKNTPSNNNNDITSIFEPASTSTTITSIGSAEELSKSKAVAAMRAKAAAQEAEDAEKLEKVDDVNARLMAWKAGKEQNLRALLATLDTLLWADAQWKGAQMSELINPKKCKITYMKAIGKVHPDKLPSSVTVEQRMLASGIFSTLNEAWDSFKAQNNL